MLTFIRRIPTTIISNSSLASHRLQSRWVLHHQSPFTTTASHPNTTTHQDPDFAIQTFKDHGFTDTKIANLIRKAPWLSSIRSTDLLSSKMNYLSKDLGLDQSHLIKLITADPLILHASLNNAIIPSITYLESILGNQTGIARAIALSPSLLRSARTIVASNINMLKNCDVPDTNIVKLLLRAPRTLVRSSKRFQELIDLAISAGFDPSKVMFVNAICIMSSMSRSTWDKKIEVFVSFGWSVEEAQLGFKRWPFMFAISEDRIKERLDFLMNVLKMGVADVLSYKVLMTCSLEKRLIPRSCVLNVLMGRGLVRKDLKVPSVLQKSGELFVKMYVEKYQDDAPEVLEAYHGKMEFLGFDHQG